jgi:tetratricopeptide (TPR) repeat protein
LAAARVKALSSTQILERLEQRLGLLTGGARDLPERQRTLRGAIEWSYDLLSDGERQLFARLSVFRGGCTLEAAEEVAEADLDTLQSLVDKSLLRHTDERYWMLETIREFAGEKLEESRDAEELRRRHAQYYLSLATRLEPYVPVEKEWLDSLEAEHDNIRAALDGLQAQGDAELALQLAESVWRFWKMRGHQAEARRRFETLLALEPAPTAARGHALSAAAAMAVDNCEYKAGRLCAEEALTIHREHDDAWGIARSFYMLGYAAIESGDFETARPLFEETVRLMVELGYEQYVGMATFNLAWAFDGQPPPRAGDR